MTGKQGSNYTPPGAADYPLGEFVRLDMRLSPDTKRLLERLSEQDERSLTQTVARLIRAEAKARKIK